MKRHLLAVAIATGMVSLGQTSDVWACSISVDGCPFAYAAPQWGTVPANAPALVFVPPPGSTAPIDEQLLFMTAAGTPLPFRSEPDPTVPGTFLIKPVDPLVEGEGYRLVSIGWCEPGSDRPLDRVNQGFVVGPPAPLPTSVGTVIAHPSQQSERTLPDDASCAVTLPVAASSLSDPNSPELAAYAHLIRRTLVVDGEVFAAERYDDRGSRVSAPYAVCPSPDGRAAVDLHGGLTAGRHHGELTVHVAGAAVDPPPVSFDFELTCDHSPAHEAGGCALGGGPDDGDRAAGVVLVGLAILARRRRLRGRA